MYDTPCKPKRPGKLALAAALALLLAGCGAAPSDEAAPAVVVTLPDREGIYQLAADYSLDGEVIGGVSVGCTPNCDEPLGPPEELTVELPMRGHTGWEEGTLTIEWTVTEEPGLDAPRLSAGETVIEQPIAGENAHYRLIWDGSTYRTETGD